MTIFLAILIALLSYVATIGLFLKGALDMILIFPKNGYILNTEKLEEHKKKTHKINVPAKSAFLLYIPVLNMIYTSYLMNKINKSVFEEMQKYPNTLIPMTEEEIKKFKKTKGTFKKMEYFIELAASIKYNDDIIDVEAYEVIEDEPQQPKQQENDLLNKYRNLRDEVNSINQELTDQDNQTFSRIL